MLMPISKSVAKTRMTMTKVTKGVAHWGTGIGGAGQPDVPDSVTVTPLAVETADKNKPWANTCGDGSTLGYTTTLAAGLQDTETKAVTETGADKEVNASGGGAAPAANGPYAFPATNHTTSAIAPAD